MCEQCYARCDTYACSASGSGSGSGGSNRSTSGSSVEVFNESYDCNTCVIIAFLAEPSVLAEAEFRFAQRFCNHGQCLYHG